jgi:uncharacterized protein with PQ loop repeat
MRLGLSVYNKDLTILLATYSFSMLGFLATIITVIIALGDKLHVKTYKKRHHMNEFMIWCFITACHLFLIFTLSILNLGQNVRKVLFDLILMLFSNSLFQIMVIGIIIGNLLFHAFNETSD